MHPDAHCRTIYNSQDIVATFVSIDREMDKEDVVHIHNGVYYSTIKKKKTETASQT